MITLIMIAAISTAMIMFKEKNPIKIRFYLIILSSTNFTYSSLNRRNRWTRLIILIIFLGGIIMIFIILSSCLPNEKTKITTNIMVYIALTAFIILNLSNSTISRQESINPKYFIISISNTLIVVMIITLYFVTFNQLISSSKTSMRSLTC